MPKISEKVEIAKQQFMTLKEEAERLKITFPSELGDKIEKASAMYEKDLQKVLDVKLEHFVRTKN